MKKGIVSLLIVASAIFFSVPAFAWTNPASNPATGGGSFIAEQNSPANVVYIKSSGNVGVGSTNPGEKLEVNGDAYIVGSGGTIGRATLANGYLKVGTSLAMDPNEFYFGTTAYFGTIGSYDLYIDTNGSTRITVQAGGNVGIGKTPTTALDVNGTVKATSFDGPMTSSVSAANVSSGAFGANTGGGNYSFPANLGINGSAITGAKLAITGGGFTAHQTDRNFSLSTGPTPGLQILASANYAGDGGTILLGGSAGPTGYIRSFATNNNAGQVIIGNRRTSDETTMYAGILLDTNGNVGVGTTTPGQKLEVGGNIKLGDNMMVEGNSSYRTYRNLASYSSDSSGSAGAFVIETNQPWNGPCMFRMRVVGYFYDATAPFDISIGAYMYNNNSFVNYGYTNIGSKKLTVRGARNVSTGNIAIIIGSEGSTYEYPKMAVAEFSQGYNSINESYADGWSIVRQTALTNYDYLTTFPDTTSVGGSVTSAANVSSGAFGANTGGGNYSFPSLLGVGTASPSYTLDVKGPDTDNAVIARFYSNTGTRGSFIIKNGVGVNPTTFIGTQGSSETLAIGTVGAEYIRITAGGNVGIGTTNPRAKFDVTYGSSQQAVFGSIPAVIGQSSNEYPSFGYNVAFTGTSGVYNHLLNDTAYAIRMGNGNRMSFLVGATGAAGTAIPFIEPMSITLGGNVGIGTTTPNSKLTVGTDFASVNGLTIDNGGTSDSAFVVRKAASKPAFGILPWDSQVYLSAGMYYDGGVWTQHSDTNDNLLFVLDPGGGARWYASNDGTSSWNVASNKQLWDAAGTWVGSVSGTVSAANVSSGAFGANTGGGNYSLPASVSIRGAVDTNTQFKIDSDRGSSNQSAQSNIYAGGTSILGEFATLAHRNSAWSTVYASSGSSTSYSGYFDGKPLVVMNTNVGIGTTAPGAKFEVKGGHGDTRARLYSTGDGGVNDAYLNMWASEPGQTYTGVGIGNNINGNTYYGRLITSRGASYIRLLDNAIELSTIDSAGTVKNGMTISNGNPNICQLISYSGGTTSCPAGYYTWSGQALASGYMLCCKVSNPI